MGFQVVPNTFIARHLWCVSDEQIENKKTRTTHWLSDDATLVLIFRQQTYERYILPSSLLLRKNNKYLFPSVFLMIPYVELTAQLKEGVESTSRTSKDMFANRLVGIVDNIDLDIARNIYTKLRNGLVHAGMTRDSLVVLHDDTARDMPIAVRNDGQIVIAPRRLHRVIVEDHKQYCHTLENSCGINAEPIENFKKVFTRLVGYSAPQPLRRLARI